MLPRAAAFFLLLVAVASTHGQEVFTSTLGPSQPKSTAHSSNLIQSAWLDLRQIPAANSKPQATPEWVEAITIVPGQKTPVLPETTIFRIRLAHLSADAQVLFFRLFFEDNAEVLHPSSAERRDMIPEPFAAMAPLHPATQDTEQFGTVTASLADETIRIGASVSQGAAFQFGLESQPLVALITFEVASPNIA